MIAAGSPPDDELTCYWWMRPRLNGRVSSPASSPAGSFSSMKLTGCPPGANAMQFTRQLDHDDFGSIQFEVINVIDSLKLERDTGGKPVPTSPHPF